MLLFTLLLCFMLAAGSATCTSHQKNDGTTSGNHTNNSTVSDEATSLDTASDDAAANAPSPTYDTCNPYVAQRQVMADNGCLCGAIYLGYMEAEAKDLDPV